VGEGLENKGMVHEVTVDDKAIETKISTFFFTFFFRSFGNSEYVREYLKAHPDYCDSPETFPGSKIGTQVEHPEPSSASNSSSDRSRSLPALSTQLSFPLPHQHTKSAACGFVVISYSAVIFCLVITYNVNIPFSIYLVNYFQEPLSVLNRVTSSTQRCVEPAPNNTVASPLHHRPLLVFG
jgi:hypothetical protein